MKLLLDTNLFLEVILGQENAQMVKNILLRTDRYEFFISDYALHSIGLLLFRRKMYETFRIFLSDILFNEVVKLVILPVREMERMIKSAESFNLDFDDAYQYAIAESYGLKIVSFDHHFDRTPEGRLPPEKVGEI